MCGFKSFLRPSSQKYSLPSQHFFLLDKKKGYLASMFVNWERPTVRGGDPIPVTVNPLHQPMVPRCPTGVQHRVLRFNTPQEWGEQSGWGKRLNYGCKNVLGIMVQMCLIQNESSHGLPIGCSSWQMYFKMESHDKQWYSFRVFWTEWQCRVELFQLG